jgi:hypothetical protein
VSSASTTKPISQETFKLLQRHLAAYHADHDAKFRNEVLAHSKDLINRVKYVIIVATRSLEKIEAKPPPRTVNGLPFKAAEKQKKNSDNLITDKKEAEEVLEWHTSFLKWYIEFLKGELVPTASYQRHITALKAFLPVLKLGKHASGSDDSLDLDVARAIFTSTTCMRLLLDLLMDPFDDVRETAAAILIMVPDGVVSDRLPDEHQDGRAPTLLDWLQTFCAKATILASKTGRADHGNGAARAQGILCSWLSAKEPQILLVTETLERLEAKLAQAKTDLGRAAVSDSIHGDFASLGYALPS